MRLPILALLAVAAAWSGPALGADLIIVNAKVFTADPSRPYARAVAIEGGRIEAVGDEAEIRRLADPHARVIDAGGRLVTPGLIEAHGHAGPGPAGQALDMPGLPWPGPTPDEALAAVRAAGGGQGWLHGVIGPLVVNDPRNWRQALDAVAPARPVMLRPWWGHGMVLNSAALRELGIDETTADPPGGWYGRAADGRLDGRVREAAELMLIRRLAALQTPAEAAEAYRRNGELYLGWGVTSYHLMAHNQSLPDALEALKASGTALKTTVYAWGLPAAEVTEAWDQLPGVPASGRVRVAGLKWVLDSTPIERDAFMAAAYADRPGWAGRSNFTDAQLARILATALERNTSLALHVSGDGELARLLTAMESAAPPARWRPLRVRIEHGDGLTPALLPRARALGVVLVANPLHLDAMPEASGLPMMRARLGEQRSGEFQRMRSVIDAGVPVALGSDAGGPAANPFLNIMLAVAGPHDPAEALTREQALTAYTAMAAFAEGREAEKGALRKGMAADLAILSQDILSAPLPSLPATRSILTLVDGRVVHAEGPFAGLAPAP